LLANIKIVQAVQVSGGLQFIWHYIDAGEKCHFFGSPGRSSCIFFKCWQKLPFSRL